MSATKTITLLALVAAASATTTACGSLSRAAGATKVSPDEFRIVTQAPLTLPPDYSLRPPRPGEPRPQESNSSDDARATLFGQDTAAQASQGERTLVNDAGATATDPSIRDTIDFESQGVVHRSQGFVDQLLSFGGGSAPASSPVDADAEQRRLAEEEATRRATGGGTVTIEGRQSGAFKLPGT
ncbi:MAG: DUF3035 domain-containing protein [Terricaulis sp.]